MAGISEMESNGLYKRISAAKKISLNNDKVFVSNIADVFKEAEYYRRAQEMGKEIKDKS
jgi:hypothetical protein